MLSDKLKRMNVYVEWKKKAEQKYWPKELDKFLLDHCLDFHW